MSLPKEIHSFICAFAGIFKLIKSERHAQFHLFATICVIMAGFLFGISKTEWIAVCFAIALVFSAEGFNTATEGICDIISPEKDERIKRIKDIAAGSVLVSAIAAAIIGLLVFIPYVIALF